jgi:chromosome segregation ATPase
MDLLTAVLNLADTQDDRHIERIQALGKRLSTYLDDHDFDIGEEITSLKQDILTLMRTISLQNDRLRMQERLLTTQSSQIQTLSQALNDYLATTQQEGEQLLSLQSLATRIQEQRLQIQSLARALVEQGNRIHELQKQIESKAAEESLERHVGQSESQPANPALMRLINDQVERIHALNATVVELLERIEALETQA